MIPWRRMQPSTARDSGQVDPPCSTTDIPPPQLAILGLHPIACRLLLINRPRRDGTLSWRWYTAATGWSKNIYASRYQMARRYGPKLHTRSSVFARYMTVFITVSDHWLAEALYRIGLLWSTASLLGLCYIVEVKLLQQTTIPVGLYCKSSNSSPVFNTGLQYAMFVLLDADRQRPLVHHLRYFTLHNNL